MAVNAIYLRISVDDDNLTESDSITAQRDMLTAYIAADPVLSSRETLVFADDGWSGTNFNRPQVKVLLDKARHGGIQTILVKDLSRWGRSYPEVNEYLDQIFPFIGIRFISLSEGYDSDNHKGRTVPMDVAFNTIIHDVYCKDLSYKVSQSYKAKTLKGEYLCGVPPFGYIKSKTDKNRLVIDSIAAETVRRVFKLACEGLSSIKIAAVLNADGVETQMTYLNRRGGNPAVINSTANERLYWASENVMRILNNELYKGVLVSGKSKTASPGSRKKIHLPESEWIRIPGVCEAIVTEDVFAKAHENLHHFKVKNKSVFRSVFTGKLKCGHCGRVLRYKATRNMRFFCEGSKVQNGKGCIDYVLFSNTLEEIVLGAVKVEAKKVLNIQERQRVIAEQSNKETLMTELKKVTGHISFLERRSISLYESFADGKIDRDEYIAVKSENGIELENAKKLSEDLTSELNAITASAKAAGKDTSLLNRVLNDEKVTGDILSLIDRILVYDGERIEIQFNFADAYEITQ